MLDHLGPLAGTTFKHLTIDSYEAGLHHWTPRMREEFRQRRGYDPTPFLLTLTGRAVADGPSTDRFLWDFRRTISDLFADNSSRFEVDLPRNGELVESGDVNDDGRADLIMRYTAADGDQASHIVRVLISKPGAESQTGPEETSR